MTSLLLRRIGAASVSPGSVPSLGTSLPLGMQSDTFPACSSWLVGDVTIRVPAYKILYGTRG